MEIAVDTAHYRAESRSVLETVISAGLKLQVVADLKGADPSPTQTLENYPAPGTFSDDDHLPT